MRAFDILQALILVIHLIAILFKFNWVVTALNGIIQQLGDIFQYFSMIQLFIKYQAFTIG